MSGRPPAPRGRPARSTILGYGALLETATVETTRQVEAMHHAIARVPFRVLRRVPGLGGLAGLVEGVHGAVTRRVYRAVRVGSGRGLAAATRAAAGTGDPAASADRPAGAVAGGVRGALNGSHGDFLAASANPLAFEMGLFADGRRLALTPAGLRAACPDASDRVCVFVHGICCDESAWAFGAGRDGPRRTYGARLEADLGYTALYLRYNTGLAIAANGRALAGLLQGVMDAYPRPIREVVLVGHSMGGLVARCACAEAAAGGLPWAARTRAVLTLGSPFGGAPLAKLGAAVTAALRRTPVTAPLAALADARSAGVKDLRGDLPAGARPGTPPDGAVAHRYVGASLAARPDGPLGRLFGDGLVPIRSAAPSGEAGDVSVARLGGLGHLTLLNEPRVYEQIRRWLAEPAPPQAL